MTRRSRKMITESQRWRQAAIQVAKQLGSMQVRERESRDKPLTLALYWQMRSGLGEIRPTPSNHRLSLVHGQFDLACHDLA